MRTPEFIRQPPRGWWLLAAIALAGAALISLTSLPSGGAIAAVGSPSGAARAALTLRLADEPQPGPDLQATQSGSPEHRLLGIYRLLGESRMDEALKATAELERSHPTFRLAQLLRADLLAARTAPLPAFGGAKGALADDQLSQLRAEALQRLKALQEHPAEGALPAEFLQLPLSVSHAIAVDTTRSRLYLFENGAAGLRLVEELYVSIGKQGVDKKIEGDQRTPLGVYFTTGQLEARLLEDRFGAGAMPLNYPNAWDRRQGRTGRGILLHGVPSNTYSRPPLDSDGCVAMANEDLQRLAARLPMRHTPVIITRQLDWVAPGGQGHVQAPSALVTAVSAWQRARVDGRRDALLAHYSDPAASPDAGTLASLRLGPGQAPARIDDISLLGWQEEPGVMVVSFRESAAEAGQPERLMRQYWRSRGGAWQIEVEGQIR